jgi:hypothetical protein
VRWKGKRINLGTYDPDEAKRRAREVARGVRAFKMEPVPAERRRLPPRKVSGQAEGADVERLIAALERDPQDSPPAGAQPANGVEVPVGAQNPPGAPAGSEVIEPEIVSTPGGPSSAGWTDDVRAAAAAGEAPEQKPPEPPPPSPDELAKLGVTGMIWGATFYARKTVYRGFVAPQVPAEGRVPLEAEFRKILEYTGAAMILPPWVTGLVIPGVTLAMAGFGMAMGFAALAEEQRKAAGAPAMEAKTVAAAAS